MEALTERFSQSGEVKADDSSRDQGEESVLRIYLIQANQLTEDTQEPSHQDTDEDGTSDILHIENRDNEQAHHSENSLDTCCVEVLREVGYCNECSRVYSETSVLQSDECDEDTDTYGYCGLHVDRDRVENRLTDIRQSQQYEEETFDEYCKQCGLP